jgi:hypothetical protein
MGWDIATIAELGTALGTIVLALATYASVRSANAAARTAERSMLQGLRPLLFPSRLSDETLKVGFVDRHFIRVPGGQGVVETTDDICYLAMSLRNVGRGMAVLDSYLIVDGLSESAGRPDHADLEQFRRLTRDLYIPPGEVFFWQAALRDTSEQLFTDVSKAANEGTPLTVELLYGDEEGVQHTVTRYAMIPHPADDGGSTWIVSVGRHWNIDGPRPR